MNTMTQEVFTQARQCLIDNDIPRDEADIVLQALCYIILDEETEQFMFNANDEAAHLKAAGITLEQINKELEYRENAGILAPEPGCRTCGFDDALCEYTIDELKEIEAVLRGNLQTEEARDDQGSSQNN